MKLPISIINHNSVIPKNKSRYRESFNTIVLPKDHVYKITNVTCKIDTTSLWNIQKQNLVDVINSNDQSIQYVIQPGYYTLDELINCLAKTINVDENNTAYVDTKQVDLSKAPDVANIFHMEQKIYLQGQTGGTAPFDIFNGLSTIKIYSSVMEQTFGINSSLIDNLIHVSIGLNNICSYDNLDINVVNQSNLDYIEWELRDMYDRPIKLNSNVYISFTISVYEKN